MLNSELKITLITEKQKPRPVMAGVFQGHVEPTRVGGLIANLSIQNKTIRNSLFLAN